MPPEYSPGYLSSPDLVCHLKNPITNQFHVTRSNPLCVDNDNEVSKNNFDREAALLKKLNLTGNEEGGSRIDSIRKFDEDFFSLSTLSMDDKVQRFLLHAVELAKQNSIKNSRTTTSVRLEPSPIYGSVIA